MNFDQQFTTKNTKECFTIISVFFFVIFVSFVVKNLNSYTVKLTPFGRTFFYKIYRIFSFEFFDPLYPVDPVKKWKFLCN